MISDRERIREARMKRIKYLGGGGRGKGTDDLIRRKGAHRGREKKESQNGVNEKKDVRCE